MGWKIYFWVFVVILLGGYIGSFAKIAAGGWISLADTILSIPSLVGLYNYAFGKNYGPRIFWQIYSVGFLVEQYWFNYFIAPSITGTETSFLVTILYSIPFIPMHIALLLYAFGNKSRR